MSASFRRDGARMLALAAAYAVTAAIGLRLGATLHDTPPLWPAAGLAVAALCIGGIRLWPGVALGTVIVFAPRANGPLLTTAIVFATTAEAVVAGWLMLHVMRFRTDLRRARDACALVFGGGVIAPAVGATIGAGTFAIVNGGTLSSFLHEGTSWYLGDAMGVIVFAPALLAWFGRRREPPATFRIAETGAFVAGLALSCFIAFGGIPLAGREDRPLMFISFPFVVWGALRLGLRTTMTALAAVAVAATVAASAHAGVFAGPETDVGALLQAYLATAAATALIVASIASERSDAIERLVESERHLSLVHEATTDRIALFSVEPAGTWRLTFANSAYLAALEALKPGIARDDVIGASTALLTERLGLVSASAAFHEPALVEVVRKGAPVHLSAHISLGNAGPNDTVLSPVRSAAGEITHVLWKSHDVGERVRAEAALRESEARLALVFNSSSDTLLLFSVDAPDEYSVVTANRSLLEMLAQHRPKHAARTLAGLPMREMITDVLGLPPEFVAKNNDLFRRVIAARIPLTYENKDWNRPDQISEVTIVPVFSDTGQCTHVLRSSRDITERKRVEDSLRLHDFVVTHAPVGVLMLDGTNRVVFANETACALLARERGDLLGADVASLDAPGAPPQWTSLLANAKERLQPSLEIDRVASDGSRHPLELSIAMLEYAGKGISCVFVRDIAERRRAETTRRTLEAELYHAQKMEAIGTLAGGIAHDFNNILAAIVGNAEMAQTELPLGHQGREDIAEVLRASRRARELVLQILTFSRKQEPERRPVRTGEVIDDVVRLMRATIPSTIELRATIAHPDTQVFGEPTQLHQVLMNLCTNASHAIGTAHGVIELQQTVEDIAAESLRGELMPGQYVCLSVKDSGHGMDRATIERAFEPFFTTKGPGVGTGLGLAVAHGIVRSHDGTITVDSIPGRGTTFKLHFPVLPPIHACRSADSEEMPRGAGERILFVDDEPAIASVSRRMLERLGYRVVALGSATDALATFRANPSAFDIVISDLTMPGLTGAQLAVEMRRVRADVPVILSTGYPDRLDADTARSLHVRELLIKPYTTEALATAVHRELRANSLTPARL